MSTTALAALTSQEPVSRDGIVLVDLRAGCSPRRASAPGLEAAPGRHPNSVFGTVDPAAEHRVAAAAGDTLDPDPHGLPRRCPRLAQPGALPAEVLETLETLCADWTWDLAGEAVWLHAQNEVFTDLAAARGKSARMDHRASPSWPSPRSTAPTTSSSTPSSCSASPARHRPAPRSLSTPTQLAAVVSSRHGSAYLAEAHTGWPAG